MKKYVLLDYGQGVFDTFGSKESLAKRLEEMFEDRDIDLEDYDVLEADSMDITYEVVERKKISLSSKVYAKLSIPKIGK